MYLSVHNNPLTALSKEEFDSMLEYFRLFQKEIRKVHNPYRLEALRHLIQAQFYATRYLDDNQSDHQEQTRHEALTEEFLNLVNMHYREQREVGFYAEKLHLTPKYLSKIVKQNSGKSANQCIDDTVVLEAKTLLKEKHSYMM
jgi:YesN/AraC family two-component response regulator